MWFSEMFSKGYFDEEFFHQSFLDRREKVCQEKYGYFLESSIALNSWASDRPPLNLIEKNPEAKFLITPGLSDNNGNGTMIKETVPIYGGLCYISKDVDDEKLAMILQVLEYINFWEDKISMWFGEKGVDVESSWDDMLQELDDAGYNLMMDELEKVLPLEEMISKYTD